MVDQLSKSFHDLEARVADLYDLIPSLVISADGSSDDLHCKQCQNILIRAYRANCVHHFCGPCVREIVHKAKPMCPIDKSPIDGRKIVHREEEKDVERRVVQVKVECPKPGCNVVLPIIDILNHYRCCERGFKNEEAVSLKYADKNQNIKNNSRKSANYGSQKTLQSGFDAFKSETEMQLQIIHTDLQAVTANSNSHSTQITQLQLKLDKLLSSHEQMQQVLSLIDQKRVKSHSKSVQEGRMKWQIADFRNKKQDCLNDPKKKLTSQKFSAYDGYQFQVDIGIIDGNLSLTLKLLPEPQDDEREFPLVGKTVITLYDHSGIHWLAKTIPFSMNRSQGRNRTALHIPCLLTINNLERKMQQSNSFQMQVIVLKVQDK